MASHNWVNYSVNYINERNNTQENYYENSCCSSYYNNIAPTQRDQFQETHRLAPLPTEQTHENLTHQCPITSVDLCQDISSVQHYLPDSLNAAGGVDYEYPPLSNNISDPLPSHYWDSSESGLDLDFPNNFTNLDGFDIPSTWCFSNTNEDCASSTGTTHESWPDITHVRQRYSCKDCSRQFAKKWELNRHRVKHEKPYRCDECHQAFTEKRRCNEHMRSRHKLSIPGKGRFACVCCNYTSIRADMVRRHLLGQHDVDASAKSGQLVINKPSVLPEIDQERHRKKKGRRSGEEKRL